MHMGKIMKMMDPWRTSHLNSYDIPAESPTGFAGYGSSAKGPAVYRTSRHYLGETFLKIPQNHDDLKLAGNFLSEITEK